MNPKLYSPAAYNHSQKQTFHRYVKRQLSIVGRCLGHTHNVRSNFAGIAVSGEIILSTPLIVVTASQPVSYFDSGLRIYMPPQGRNLFAPLSMLDTPSRLATDILDFIEAETPFWKPPHWGWAPYQLPPVQLAMSA